MGNEHLIVIITGLISLVAGWGSSVITNRPKKEDSHMNRINIILEQYEKREERSKIHIEELHEKNGALKKEKKEVEEKLKECEEDRLRRR